MKIINPFIVTGRLLLAICLMSGCTKSTKVEETGDDDINDFDPSSYAGADPVPLDALCDVFRNDACYILTECMDWEYRDMDHCLADNECLGMAQLRAEVDAGWLVYDAAAVGQCHAFVRDYPCEFGGIFFFSVPSVSSALGLCAAIGFDPGLTGLRAPGETCVTTADCWPNGACFPDDSCPGTCLAFAGEGEACDDEVGPECAWDVDLRCQDGVCKRIPGLGEPCGQTANVIYLDGECGPDLWCDQTEEVCKAAAGEGAPCTEFGDGTAPACGHDLWCDSRADVGICRTASGNGGPCFDSWECGEGLICLAPAVVDGLGTCGLPLPEGATCVGSDDCAEGLGCADSLCVPLPGIGQECLVGDCASGLTCEGTVCVFARYPGDPCGDAESVCVQSLCRDTACVARARLGEACLEDNDCASGTCDPGGTCVDPNDCLP